MSSTLTPTQYVSNGMKFNVTPDRLEEFMQKYPDAKLASEAPMQPAATTQIYYTEDGKQFRVSPDQIDSFKSKHPTGRTIEEWNNYIKEEQDKYKKELEENKRKHAEALAAESERVQKSVDKINSDFENHFENKEDENYIKLKDASPQEKAKYLKEIELNEKYSNLDNGELSFWGNMKNFVSEIINNPSLVPGQMMVNATSASAQQKSAYDAELEIQRLNTLAETTNQYTNSEEYEKIMQEKLELHAKLDAAYRDVNVINIQGGVNYLDGAIDRIKDRKITELGKEYIITNEEGEEIVDTNNPTYQEELIKIQNEEIEITREDFDSDLDFNLYNKLQEDRNVLDGIKKILTQKLELEQSIEPNKYGFSGKIEDPNKEEILNQARNLTDYNNNPEYKQLLEELQLKLEAAGTTLSLEEIAEKISSGETMDALRFGGASQQEAFAHAGVNKLGSILEENIENAYIDQIKTDYKVQENWMTDGYKVTVGLDDEAMIFQGQYLITKPTKGLIERAGLALGDAEDYLQSKGKTTLVDGVEVDAQLAAKNEAFQELITSDSTFKLLMNNYAKEAKPILERYRRELEENYDLSKKENVIKVNQLLDARQKELTIDKLYNSEEWKKITTSYGMALDNVAQNYDTEFKRNDSWILWGLDKLRAKSLGETDYIPINDTIADTLEGFISGTEGISSAIADKAWGSIAGNRYRTNKARAEVLDQQLKDGDFTKEDRVYWENGKFHVWESGKSNRRSHKAGELSKELKEDKDYWQKEIVEQVEDVAESEEWLSLFKQADYSDGLSFGDIALTVGQAAPHIGLAAAGAATGNPVLAYLGTATMFAQMYGDNYWSAIEKNLDRTGLSREKLKKAYPDKSDEEIERLYIQAASNNLQSGQGANMFHSAAMAAVQTALETYGAQQVVGGTQKALAGKIPGNPFNLGNIFKTSMDDIGLGMLRGLIHQGGSAVEEFGTEFMQEIVGQVSTAQQAGLESTALINLDEALQAGIGGAITGFMLPFSGSMYRLGSTAIRQKANDIALKYAPESSRSKAVAISNAWFENAKNKLDKEYKNKLDDPAKKQEYYNKIRALSNSYNASVKLGLLGKGKDNFTQTMTPENRRALLDYYVDIENLQTQIEGLDKNDPQVLILKEQLKDVQYNAAELIKAEKTTSRVTQIMKDVDKAKEIVVLDDLSVKERKALRKSHGFGDRTTGVFGEDGKIYIDKNLSAQLKSGNTAAHELLHKVMFNTLYDVDGEGKIQGKNVAQGLVNALDGYLDQLDPENTRGGEQFAQRLKIYKDRPNTIKAEEKLMLFADAIENGDIKFNENVFTKIGDVVRRFLQDVGIKDVKFNSGKDVYNFLKDYNVAVKKGKLGEALTNVMEEGAEVGEDIERITDDENLGVLRQSEAEAMDSYAETDALMNDPDFDLDNTLDQRRALKAGTRVIEATLNRLWRPGSLLTRDEFRRSLENEYLKTLEEYDEGLDVNLQGPGKQTSNLFNKRAGAIAKENLGKGERGSLDSEQAKQVPDTTKQKDFDEPVTKKDTQRKKVLTVENKVIDREVAGEIKNQIKENTRSTISLLLNKGKSVEEIVKALDKEAKEIEFKDVKGKKTISSEAYETFIDNLIKDKFIRNIAVADMKSRFRNLFNVKETGRVPQKGISPKTGKPTNWNKQVFSVTAPSNTALKEYFIPKNLKNLTPGEKDTYTKRANSLFNLIAKDVKIESLQELKNDKDYMNKLETILKKEKSPLTATQLIDAIDQRLDRRNLEDTSLDTVRASKALDKNIYRKFGDEKYAKDLKDSKSNIDTQFGKGTSNTIAPNQTWESFKRKQIARGIDWDGQIAANDESRMQRDWDRVRRDNKRKQKEFKAREYRISRASIAETEKDFANQTIQQQFSSIEKAQGLTPWAKMSKVNKVKMVNTLLSKLSDSGLGRIISSTNLTSRALPWLNTAEQITITSLNRLKNAVDKDGNKRYSAKDIKQLESDLKQGKIIETSQLIKDLGDDFNKEIKLLPTVKPQKKLRGKNGIINVVKNNLKNLTSLEADGIEIRKTIRDVLRANPELLPAVNFVLYQVNNSAGFARMMAPLVGYINQKGFNQKFTVGEHSLQYGNFVKLFTQQALVLNDSDFEYFNKWLSESYIQVQLGDGKNATWNGSGIKIQDQTYEANSPNLFDGGEVGVKWVGQNQLHPQIQAVIDQVNNGELSWKDVYETMPDLAQVRNFSEYGYKNPNTFMYKGKTMAEHAGAKVDDKYTKVNSKTGRPVYPNVVKVQAYAVNKVLTNQWTKVEAQKFVDTMTPLAVKETTQNATIANIAGDIITTFKDLKSKDNSNQVVRTSTQVKEILVNSNKAKINAQKLIKKSKGLSAFDLDDTLALTKEKVLYTMPDGTKGELTAGEFAVEYESLLEQGTEFDFSNFENIDLSTEKGPLAGVALERQAKYGSKDIYVVTARPGAAKQAIKTFLDSIGLNIPIDNIITLEDGSPQAKADWILNKAEQGYNDFYFADDSALNVQTVKDILSQIDVKSKVQVARMSQALDLDNEFNKQLEEVTGKEAFKQYSDVRGKLEGKRKDKGLFKRFLKQFTITPSAEDFMGLMYDIIGKGEQGNKHMKFIKDNLIDLYNKAEQEILSAKVTVANDFAALKKSFPTLRSTIKGNPLMQEIGVGPYTRSQAIRVYLWNKQGMDIPGISKRDVNRLVKAVENDFELKQFAEGVGLINKNKTYPAPVKNWLAGDITSDILRGLDTVYRSELMTQFNENVDIIFSEKNKNKLRALYGNKWVEALEDSIRRMKAGSNRPVYVGGGARLVNEMLDWLNSSVGAVMFINVKSGLLQLISNVNFINWGDNNIYAAAKAFVSKEYWPTVMKLLNSDYLVNRRDGLKINVNEAELADAGRKGGIKGAINYLLDKGFIITRIMDSLAIATGGATFYINRVKSLLNRVNPETNKKYTKAEAEAKAFDDFYAISEESQQSSNPAKISQQQASMAGRVILSFQNVTMQYNRMTKKAIRDLYNRRKQPGMTQRESDLSNISKIVYYTTVQNLIFNALQQAIFAVAFDDEGDEEEKDKTGDILNGMSDSLLFGLGFGGAVVSTVKNVLLKVLEENEKKSPDYEEAVWEIFNVSPVLDSKVRKLRTTAKTFSWNMKDIKKRGWSLDNPSYLAISQLISAATNIPIDRVMRKVMNMRQAMDDNTRTWQRIALILGYSGWSLGLPYWGLESTITREAEQEEKIKNQYKIDATRLKDQGYKRIPLTGKKSWVDGIPKDMKLNRDYIQVERPTGTIEYWLIPKNKKK